MLRPVAGFDRVRSYSGLGDTGFDRLEQEYAIGGEALASQAKMRAAEYGGQADLAAAQARGESSMWSGLASGLSSAVSAGIKGYGSQRQGTPPPAAPESSPGERIRAAGYGWNDANPSGYARPGLYW